MKKYILFSLIAISFYFGGLTLHYNNMEKEFLSDLANAINNNNKEYIEKYTTHVYKEDLLQELPEAMADNYLNLNYEWSVFKDSVHNIKSHDVIAENSFYTNMIFYISKTGCYSVVFNEFYVKPKVFCARYTFNDVNISFIEQIYL